ncbi:MAG TPA: NAD(P)-dependent oxidoreductase [Edaphobacter sp.]|uniref:NAD(P)-dependent oxidoreductase n=1 Tax=Edaphobacter sp. TaxID=1934404 RepID=UPI002C957BC6|nr:NAD(P)-dependent oxidoreductase [Edaphobacter sp.]HUZ95413.1 NAD(P)-dependent oxidoreductase [Edaphobacter sp.]
MSKSVAILGLGTMGVGMAANLLKAGFSLAVYNRTPEKAKALVGDGARLASTPAEAVRDASIVISMLADDAASREVWMGHDGALAAVKKDTILIESSTVSPAWIAEFADATTTKGAKLLDAPVTGSRIQAASGQLSFLIGGEEATLEAATPVLKAMSKEIIHLGPVGSGARMKLINNFLCGVQIASLAEGLTWIERSGLDGEKALAVLKAGAPGSPLLGAISARMTAHDYSVNFLLKLMAKDLRYAEEDAAHSKVSLKTAEAARSLFDTAVAKGFADKDMSSVIEPIRSK